MIGKNAVIRSGAIIYCAVVIGDNFQSGHNVVISGKIPLSAIGFPSELQRLLKGNTHIGNNVSMQSMVYIPTNTVIGDNVFIGPNTVLTNDRYPPFRYRKTERPTDHEWCRTWRKRHITPGICIGEGALVAAGAIVTRDVPARKLAIGTPARITDLPYKMVREVPEK